MGIRHKYLENPMLRSGAIALKKNIWNTIKLNSNIKRTACFDTSTNSKLHDNNNDYEIFPISGKLPEFKSIFAEKIQITKKITKITITISPNKNYIFVCNLNLTQLDEI
jgi:hypothetical protein